jgi:hypothetical protein
MSSVHGAGLMLLPVLLGLPTPAHAEDVAAHALPTGGLAGALLFRDVGAVVVHTAAMLAVMTVVAAIVYTGTYQYGWETPQHRNSRSTSLRGRGTSFHR